MKRLEKTLRSIELHKGQLMYYEEKAALKATEYEKAKIAYNTSPGTPDMIKEIEAIHRLAGEVKIARAEVSKAKQALKRALRDCRKAMKWRNNGDLG